MSITILIAMLLVTFLIMVGVSTISKLIENKKISFRIGAVLITLWIGILYTIYYLIVIMFS